jgi:hypothetical protein
MSLFSTISIKINMGEERALAVVTHLVKRFPTFINSERSSHVHEIRSTCRQMEAFEATEIAVKSICDLMKRERLKAKISCSG